MARIENIVNSVSKLVVSMTAVAVALYTCGALYIVNEGHIGLYSRGGALLSAQSPPGLHMKLPLVTKLHQVQVTVQTDQVTDIPCGTSGGLVLYFDKIEVVNRLRADLAYQTIKNYTIHYDQTWVFDKIHHEINQFCSKNTLHQVYITKFDELDDYLQETIQKQCDHYAPGIEIISIRVTKPHIPSQVAQNYENLEIEKLKLQIDKESQKVGEKQLQTKQMLEKIRAETEVLLSQIQIKKNIMVKHSSQKVQEVQMAMRKEEYDTIDQATIYRNNLTHTVNQQRINRNYMVHKTLANLKHLHKTYYGESLSQYLKQNMEMVK